MYYNLGLFWKKISHEMSSRPALIYESFSVSYGDLDVLSDRLCMFLMEKACKRGDVIAIAHNKRPLAYAAMLACLKLGMPYVIIDAASPVARLAKILNTANPVMLFYDTEIDKDRMTELSDARGISPTFLDEAMLPEHCSDDQIKICTNMVDGASIAYIMFTSGSTGDPKGVAVSHSNLFPFIEWAINCFKIIPADIFANLSPMYFDNSVFDFYTGLFSGAALVPIMRELLQAPYELVKYVGSKKCTIWFSVPSLFIYLMSMKAMRPEELPCIRSISFGGEGYPKVELKKLYDLFSAQATIVNVYGPTECTCICSSYFLNDDDFTDLYGLPPLGKLNPDFDYLIDDGNADTVAQKGAGELILIGPNVGAGYFNDIEKTEKSFFTIYKSDRFGKRAYRTGDIVEEKDGLLYFIGRSDNQIKHMGYRIELEEIEKALMRIPGITQAAVIYLRENTAFGKIYAFASCDEKREEKEVLKLLTMFIPDYMIPSRLRLMQSLPKNANGKVDRQALKALLK